MTTIVLITIPHIQEAVKVVIESDMNGSKTEHVFERAPAFYETSLYDAQFLTIKEVPREPAGE